ncbi:hypothetical protein [Paraburkholderia sp. SUR17]|uniref:hypothetical protein n=1 Tax=Paraburkholderia sp. SUR17 TaxID=3034358 RepID=UPI002407C156|nr:hypothetical protein [Paraburkholderia sp. SUR17]WEY42050.1 hypothetical protein P2869_18465 [Paraburkholderia sp. SUR17]
MQLWGRTLEFWDVTSQWLVWVAAAAAGLGTISGLLGAIISHETSALIQRTSDEKIAVANAKAAEANLELERLRAQVGPRQLRRDKFIAALHGKYPFPTEIQYVRDDPDSFNLAVSVFFLLTEAKWPVSYPDPVLPPLRPSFEQPLALTAGGQPSGVTIVTSGIDVTSLAKPVPQDDFEASLRALQTAFVTSLGRVAISGSQDMKPECFRIVIAPR